MRYGAVADVTIVHIAPLLLNDAQRQRGLVWCYPRVPVLLVCGGSARSQRVDKHLPLRREHASLDPDKTHMGA